jgi:hypothetical protein
MIQDGTFEKEAYQRCIDRIAGAKPADLARYRFSMCRSFAPTRVWEIMLRVGAE